MLKALSKHGANINIKAADGTTPLMLARAAGNTLGDDLACDLISLGADKEAIRTNK